MPVRQALTFDLQEIARSAQQADQFTPRDLQDLMAYPFFSLTKDPRLAPIYYRRGKIFISLEASENTGIATIWDADILIWAISKINRARNSGQNISASLVATPYEILTFLGKDLGHASYRRLNAALNRLEKTIVTTSLRPVADNLTTRFNWIESWRNLGRVSGKSLGLEIVLSHWLYRAVMHDRFMLTLDRDYFKLTGGIERWLYRLVRKHGGHQPEGWQFEFRHLFLKAASLSSYSHFTREIRDIVARQSLPGYFLEIHLDMKGNEILAFRNGACGKGDVAIGRSLQRTIGSSLHTVSDDRDPISPLSYCNKNVHRTLNLYSKLESNLIDARPVNNSPNTGLGKDVGKKTINQRKGRSFQPTTQLDLALSSPDHQALKASAARVVFHKGRPQ